MRETVVVKLENRSKSKRRSSGFTLIEVTIAMALTTLMCVGLYGMGLSARRSAERNRLSTEARSFAKELLEEVVGIGRGNLAKPTCTLLQTSVVKSSGPGYLITRTPQAIWHAADGSVVAAPDADYAEVHITVSYPSPQIDRTLSDTYSMLLN